MMVDHTQVKLAIRRHLLLATGLPPVNRFAWDSEPYDPVQGETWIKETYRPAQERKISFGMIEVLGVSYFEVFFPVDVGSEPGEDLAKIIADQFEPGTPGIGQEGLEIMLERCERMGVVDAEGDLKDAWKCVQVAVNWRTYVFTS